MYHYYDNHDNLKTTKYPEIEQEINDLVAIALTNSDMKIAVITPNKEHLLSYLLDILEPKEIITTQDFGVLLSNYSSITFFGYIPIDKYYSNKFDYVDIITKEDVTHLLQRKKNIFSF